jgi:4-amino-4-deoxy-L-arabinose transferase-like glycosyltransferase
MLDRIRAYWNRDAWGIGVAVLLGVMIRFAAILMLEHEPVSDELAYRSMALSFIERGVVLDNLNNLAHYNVGYPLFILAPVFYVFGDHILAARLANLVLGVLSIVMCYLVAKEAGASRFGRFLAAAFWAMYLPAGVYGVYLAKENLMAPLMLGVVWCALRLVKSPGTFLASFCGLLFGLLALVGNAGLSLVAVILWALWKSPARWLQGVSIVVLIACVAGLVAAPWVVRNAYVLGAPVINTNGGFNFYLGNNPAATGWFVSIADTPRGSSWADLRRSGEVEASKVLKNDALEWIEQNPAAFASLSVKKFFYFWMPPSHAGEGEQSLVESTVRFFWLVQFVVFGLLALAGLFFSVLRQKSIMILWGSLFVYSASHMVFYVIFRYREPIMPILVILASFSAAELLARFSRARSAA